jgi:chromosome segregation ATPase
MDTDKLLARLDERSLHMSNNISDVLDQLKKLNSKIAHHENEIHKIKLDIASAHGVWSGVNKALVFGIAIMGIVIGAIASFLWH